MSETKPVSKVRRVPEKEPFAPGHRACVGCGEVLALRLAAKAFPDNVIVTMATGCMEVVSSQFPHTSWRVPWIHTLFENTASTASGIEAGVKALVRKGRKEDIGTKVIAMGGDGATADIGLQALSGALERGHDLLYICFDNEAYMNTGIQRSSSTPYGAATTTSPAGKLSIGQKTKKKNMPAIVAAHGIPYVATASHSYPFDLIEKVRKGIAVPGPAYIHIYSACPTGWRSKPEQSVKLGKMAVQTGIFPLYEIENGVYKMRGKNAKLKPVDEYLKAQGRFRHLSDDVIAEIQEQTIAEYQRLQALSQ